MSFMWIVVADSYCARIFTKNGRHNSIQEIDTVLCPEARQNNRSLVEDNSGRAKDRSGAGSHAMEKNNDHKHTAVARFAKTVADKICDARKQNKFDEVALVAPPEFLGMLRSRVDKATQRYIRCELPQDLTRHDKKAIDEHVLKKMGW